MLPDADPVVVAVVALTKRHAYWVGMCKDLYRALAGPDGDGCPVTQGELKTRLRKAAPALMAAGVEIYFPDVPRLAAPWKLVRPEFADLDFEGSSPPVLLHRLGGEPAAKPKRRKAKPKPLSRAQARAKARRRRGTPN